MTDADHVLIFCNHKDSAELKTRERRIARYERRPYVDEVGFEDLTTWVRVDTQASAESGMQHVGWDDSHVKRRPGSTNPPDSNDEADRWKFKCGECGFTLVRNSEWDAVLDRILDRAVGGGLYRISLRELGNLLS